MRRLIPLALAFALGAIVGPAIVAETHAAALTDPQRSALWARLMQHLSSDRETVALNKTDLRAAVNAADAWVDSNAASYNSALPVAARTNLTARQKARLLAYVVQTRYEVQ